jgi:hypothetical protein
MKEVTYKIESVTPMLMNNIHSMFVAKEKPARTKHEDWEQGSEMFQARMYLEGGKLALPSRVIKGVLKEACKGSGIKQPGKRSGYADLVQSVIFMPESLVLEQTVKDIEKEQAFVGMNGTKKVLRVWPKLTTWSGNLKLIIADEKQFDPKILKEILEFAGRFVGIGDYRPEYGRFNVK